MNPLKEVLKNQIELVQVSNEVKTNIDKISSDFVKDLQNKLKKKKIGAEVFIGGSLAKGTLVKKGTYDIDIFVRFNEKYRGKDISHELGRVLGKKVKRVHGSRDYYQFIVDGIVLEIVPVLGIKNPEDAENVTDLSYFHVNYLLKKIRRKKKIAGEIMLAKAFCSAQNCYGAEGYIHGFSGYSLELLMCYYESFERFLKEVITSKNKIIIDDAKFFKRKKDILTQVNESKILSPIILIDPTFKERNALAGLNEETFAKFKEVSKKFLKNPSPKFFDKVNVGEEIRKKYGKELKIINVSTNKQVGDIAGTKSRKFFDFFNFRLNRNFVIKKSEFEYDSRKNIAYFYFVLDKKKDEIIRGPPVSNKKNLSAFKKANKGVFVKNGFGYLKRKYELSFENWFKLFVKKEEKIIKQMSIKEIKLRLN